MTRTAITKSTRPSRYGLLGIYLNDHLAGATAGTELARRMARSHQEREEAALLKRLAAEISQDRSALLDIMTTLGIPVRATRSALPGWARKPDGSSSTAASSHAHH
jgi:N-acetylglucosamine kinase-like BadF-type ATPase